MSSQLADLLADVPGARPWQLPGGARKGFEARYLLLGRGSANPLEVVTATSPSKPKSPEVRNLWTKRQGNRPSPLLLIVAYGDRAAVCGPVGPDPAVELDLDPGQIERIALAALEEPDRHAATRLLLHTLPEATSELPGIRNVGMFATHELRAGIRSRTDWTSASEGGKPLLDLRGQKLVEALGFEVETHGTSTSVLVAGGRKQAVAVFLDEHETPEAPSTRFGGVDPVSQALAAADREALPFLVLTRGSQIRIYAAEKEVGVGRKGRAETFLEINLALLPDDLAGYLPLIFGAGALERDGTFWQILDESRDFATGLGTRLRERVYNDVVPALAAAVANHFEKDDPDEGNLRFLYEEALTILFRLLFIAYAEDKDVLPYRSNGRYQEHSLKHRARDLADRRNEGEVAFDPTATDLWSDLLQLFRAVDKGNRDWGVPHYNGGLFSTDRTITEVGEAIAGLELTNAEIGPALLGLLVDEGEEGFGPVDFRSLSVREFGTIYEGLLESDISISPTDLGLDKGGTYVPATDGDEVLVDKGEIYLRNRSGARKATGSYFTKPFAVEHLLDHSLEPALDEHLARMAEMLERDDEAAATEAFFDFRVADIAMGSGHFLVAAVDRIERRLSSFLAEHAIPGVIKELDRLRARAFEELGEQHEAQEIQHASLLRRQVARRCIYGVDINPIAVELARLAVWIHTFVKGLPLSFLDHNLVTGNSLTGIGEIEEAVQILDPDAEHGTVSLHREHIETMLERARDSLRKLARVSDASAAEVREARKAQKEIEKAVRPAHVLFDLLIGVRLGEVQHFESFDEKALLKHKDLETAEALADELQTLHFSIAFPEVFLRDRPGFDVIVGNPPWEKVKIEEHGWWGLRFPGIRSMPVGQQNAAIAQAKEDRPDLAEQYAREVTETDALRAILTKGPYPGMGRGDPDLYKAFAWRFWHLIREEGAIGVVLPRSALASSGSADWREHILGGGTFQDVTLLVNRRLWAFEDIHPQWTIGLVTIRKGHTDPAEVHLKGPFASLAAFDAGHTSEPVRFPVDAFRTWATGAAFPLLPSPESGDVFLKLRAHPRFDDSSHPWRARPVREFDATLDKQHMITEPESTDGLWPVYKGASFNLWDPDTGEYYAWADLDHVTGVLQEKRLRQNRHERSAFSEFERSWAMDPTTLPCLQARVAFRDVARATDSRTLIAALCPPEIVFNHKAPYLLWPRGDERDQAFVLGVLSSIPCDWYARTLVEVTMSFEILNGFPIPNPQSRDSGLRRRVEEIAGRLAAMDDRFADWAEAVGVPVGSVNSEDAKHDLIHELDAAVALLYSLEESDVAHIFETFHVGWDYQPRLDAVLKQMRDLKELA